MRSLNIDAPKFFARNMQAAVWRTLEEDMFMENIPFARGSEYKAFETQNFGYVVFKQSSKCPDGAHPGKRIFRY